MTDADAMASALRYQQAGNFAQAETVYRQVLAAEPAHANARFRLAVICQIQGRMAEAIEHYRQLLEIQPGSAQGRNNIALALAALGQHADALQHCQKAVELQPDCAEFHNNLGTMLNALERRDEAASSYRRALELKPHYAAAWNNLGKVQLLRNQTDDAVRSYQQALTLMPNDPAILSNLGSALLQQGKAIEAANCFRHALRLRPDHAEARHNLGLAHETIRKWEETAQREQERLTHAAPDARAMSALGDLYYYALGKYAEAGQCYRKVSELDPSDARARFLAEVLSGSSAMPRIPADQVAAMYDMGASEFEERARRRGDRSPAMLLAVLGAAPPTPCLDVLDLGCGTGLCGAAFRGWARRLVGVDLSAKMLAEAGRRQVYDELHQADLLSNLANAPASFDLILASDVLLFFGDLTSVFHAVHAALRPSGRFAFTLDTHAGPESYQLTPWAHYAHALHYVRDTAARAGLHELAAQQVIFPRDSGFEAAGVAMVLKR